MLARGWRALGRASLADGDDEAAVGQFGRALDVFTRLGMPLEVARAHLLLARALRGHGSAAAVAEARAALAVFEDLGAAADAVLRLVSQSVVSNGIWGAGGSGRLRKGDRHDHHHGD